MSTNDFSLSLGSFNICWFSINAYKCRRTADQCEQSTAVKEVIEMGYEDGALRVERVNVWLPVKSN